MAPRSGEVVVGQGRARGWLAAAAGGWRLRCRQEEHHGSCQGLGGSLARACSWHVLLSGAQAKAQPRIPFPRKNAVKRVFFFFFCTGCWRFGDGATWGVSGKRSEG